MDQEFHVSTCSALFKCRWQAHSSLRGLTSLSSAYHLVSCQCEICAVRSLQWGVPRTTHSLDFLSFEYTTSDCPLPRLLCDSLPIYFPLDWSEEQVFQKNRGSSFSPSINSLWFLYQLSCGFFSLNAFFLLLFSDEFCIPDWPSSSGWPWTCRDPPASISRALGLQLYPTTPTFSAAPVLWKWIFSTLYYWHLKWFSS